MRFKIKYHRAGDHIHTRVFAGQGEQLALTGTLVMRHDEWAAWNDVIRAGSDMFDGQSVQVEFVREDPYGVAIPTRVADITEPANPRPSSPWNPCGECGLVDGKHEEYCSRRSTWEYGEDKHGR